MDSLHLPIHCRICGNEFEPLHYNAMYCSDSCREEAHRRANLRYEGSEARREQIKSYKASAASKESNTRYNRSAKGKAASQRYEGRQKLKRAESKHPTRCRGPECCNYFLRASNNKQYCSRECRVVSYLVSQWRSKEKKRRTRRALREYNRRRSGENNKGG